MEKIYISLTIGLIASSLVAMEAPEQAPMVTLESITTGKTYQIPREMAQLSTYISDALETGVSKVPLPKEVSDQTLITIVQTLNAIHQKLQEQQDGTLAQKDFVQRKDGGFIAQNIKPLVEPALKNLSIDLIKNFIIANNILDFPFLINAGAKVYVERFLKNHPNAEWDKLKQAIELGGIEEDIHIYFKKHFKLAKAGAKEELSIADYIALHGQPTPTPNLRLLNKKLTSLYGINQIENPKNIKRLYLLKNFILDQDYDPDYPVKPFEKFSTLENLDLQENQITTIKSNTFQGLNKLERLKFNHNKITTIQTNAFQGLNNLRNLNLHDNQITTIEPGTFQGLNNLKDLLITNNKITTIEPNAFQGLNNLRNLNLFSNQITTIQTNAFQGLGSLKSLALKNNSITTIQTNAFQGLNKLRNLNLFSNQITTIQTNAFQGLNKLRSLDLRENQITTIQTNAFQGLNNLKDLLITNNKITTIEPNAFQGLNNLRTLWLKNNPLTESAEEIKQKHFPDQEININISD